MIPKVIHYTWFSNDPFPREVEECMATWKKHMPDYTLRRWDMESIKHIDNVFVKEALAERKWAYVSDYVRLYALYQEGGIYLDTDVEVFQSFDPFLEHTLFIGQEQWMKLIDLVLHQNLTSHCFGAEKGHEFLLRCMNYYNGRHFITSTDTSLPQNMRYDFTVLPDIQGELARFYFDVDTRWKPSPRIQYCKGDIVVCPPLYFDALTPGKNRYCHHLCIGAWREGSTYIVKKESAKTKIRWSIERILRPYILKHFHYLFRPE